MFKQIKFVAIIAILATTAMAASASVPTANTAAGAAGFVWNHGNFEKLVALKDGSTLHEFSDGKMAVESPYGKAVFQPIGQAVQAVDGSAITISSNEVARLSQELRTHR